VTEDSDRMAIRSADFAFNSHSGLALEHLDRNLPVTNLSPLNFNVYKIPLMSPVAAREEIIHRLKLYRQFTTDHLWCVVTSYLNIPYEESKNSDDYDSKW